MRSLVDKLAYPRHKYMVGPPQLYEELGRHQFELLKSWGLAPSHSLLDIGCGSLRAGHFFIRYLSPDNYFGLEPNRQLVEDGLKFNLTPAEVVAKRPRFNNNDRFKLTVFDRKFDFLLAHSIFTHAPLQQIQKCLCEARLVMRADSLFFANYNRGEADFAGDKWIAPGVGATKGVRGAVCYRPATLFRLATGQGLECAEINVWHPTGGTWLLFYDSANGNAKGDQRLRLASTEIAGVVGPQG